MPEQLYLAVLLVLTLGSCTGRGEDPGASSVEISPTAEEDSSKQEELLSFLQKQDPKLAELTAAELGQVKKVRLNHDYTSDELALLNELPELREVMIWRDGDERREYRLKEAPTDADLQILASIGQLETLRIGGWNVPYRDAGMAALTKLRRLKHLYLTSAQRISDESMKSVAAMPALETLDISYMGITDLGLAYLMESSSLQRVRYGWGGRTRSSLAAFQEAHPEPGFVME